MKIEGLIYLFAPLESDLEDRAKVREHFARSTAGRLFLKKSESESWSIPFGSVTQLIRILNLVSHMTDTTALDYNVEPAAYEQSLMIDVRRCLRIRIQDINAEIDPLRYAAYLGVEGISLAARSDFNSDSIGLLTLLDADSDYKYHKLHFEDFFDAGIKIDKMFAAEVYRRIPVEEKVNAQ